MSHHVPATTPYPWPYDGDLAGSGTALVVITPSGARPPAELIGTVSDLAGAVRRCGGTVVSATTTAPARVQGSSVPAADPPMPDPLGWMPPDHAVRAAGIDAFYGSDLDLILRTGGIARLLLAGCDLETSVHSTMRDANDRGYECLLVVDACAAVDQGLVAAAVSMIEMSGGIFGAVGRSADVIAALDRAQFTSAPDQAHPRRTSPMSPPPEGVPT
jgi:biuret amidohydrolase